MYHTTLWKLAEGCDFETETITVEEILRGRWHQGLKSDRDDYSETLNLPSGGCMLLTHDYPDEGCGG